MAITRVGLTAPVEGTAASTVTVDRPAGVVEGDLLLAQVMNRRAGSTVTDHGLTPPTGWTLVDGALTRATSTQFGTVWQKIATSSEPSSYAWTYPETGGQSGIGVVAYRGAVVAGSSAQGEDSTTESNPDPHSAASVTFSGDPISGGVAVLCGTCVFATATSTSSGWSPGPHLWGDQRPYRVNAQETTGVTATSPYAPPSVTHISGNFSSSGHSWTQVAVLLRETPVGPTLSLAAATPGLTSVISLDAASPMSLTAEVPGLTSAFTLDVALPPEVALTGSLPGLAGNFAVEASSPMSLAASLPGLTGALNLTAETISALSLVAELPGLTSVITLDKPPQTDTSNRVGGRERGGYGVATWTPAVVAPPATAVVPQGLDVLEVPTTDTPDLTVGKPVFTYDTVTAPRHRDRIIVAGRDVTFFRGAQTPTPAFRKVEPFVYGAGSMSVPQVYPAFEQMGVGDRKWIRKGAPVTVQRVDPDTGAVVATDYRGFITNLHRNGNTLTLELGGKVTGRMALVDKQPPLFRTTKDVGNWVASAVRQGSRASFRPTRGPVTGINLQSRGGGGTMLDHAAELVALAVTTGGRQYTVGERANGTWGMWLKDTTTIDATVYFDDSRIVADLHSAIAEEPNRVYASAVTKDGRRIKFAAYPGLKQGDPARYPFANTATTFGLGTTSDETDYPALLLIQAFKTRLVTMGFLDAADNNDGTLDAAAVAAVESLQAEAELPRTGVVNLATWEAAFDISATGFSLAYSEILPAAQDPRTKPWRRSGSGAQIARNPPFDPHLPVVDQTLNMGRGYSRRQIRNWSKRQLVDASTPNWIGTVTVNGAGGGCMALVRGEHAPGDPITSADIMPAREIRPGMNIWAPLHDGGTLFHVSGVSVPEGGNSPTFTIDTRARDTMAAWEVITRNRESRNNLARAWLGGSSGGGMPANYIEWDDVAGRLDESVAVKSGAWTVFPVVAGQEGTVAELRARLAPAVRFSMAVFARKVSAKALDHRFPQPLSEAGDAAWDKPAKRTWLKEHGFVYQAGQSDQPAGYWPGREQGNDGEPTGDPVTGKWEDDAGFSYYTEGSPVLWVAVWAFESDSKVVAGRIMKALLAGGAP